jgi:hypothetical protein
MVKEDATRKGTFIVYLNKSIKWKNNLTEISIADWENKQILSTHNG